MAPNSPDGRSRPVMNRSFADGLLGVGIERTPVAFAYNRYSDPDRKQEKLLVLRSMSTQFDCSSMDIRTVNSAVVSDVKTLGSFSENLRNGAGKCRRLWLT